MEHSMNAVSRVLTGTAAALVLAVGTANAQAGLTSGPASTVTLNATKSTSLTLAVSTPSSNIAAIADNAINAFDTPVNMSTSWNLNAAANVSVVAWFGTPAAALTFGGNNIASSRIEGRVVTGTPTTFTAFTGAAVAAAGSSAGGSLSLFTQAATAGIGSRSDVLDLQLNLTGQPALPAGVYTGVLNLRAITQ
jgi:hypothetical protein